MSSRELMIRVCLRIVNALTLFNSLQELLFPLIEIGKRLLALAGWEEPFKSFVFLLCFLYMAYRCCFLICSDITYNIIKLFLTNLG